MSHLTDLLSKLKQSELKKEIPPGFSDTIVSVKKKESGKRRILILSIFIVATLSLGLATAYKDALNTGIESDKSESLVHLEEFNHHLVKDYVPPANQEADNTQKTEQNAEIEHPRVKENTPAASPEQDNSNKAEDRKDIKKDIDEQVTNLLYIARNYEQSGDFSKAVENYKKVVRIDPQNYKVMNNIAALFIRMNLWNESLGYLQDSIKLKDNYVPSLINLGIVYAKTGKTTEAESSFLRAISLDEENHSALFNIAVLYENQGAYDRALEYYQKLKILGDREGINGLKRLESKQLKPDIGE